MNLIVLNEIVAIAPREPGSARSSAGGRKRSTSTRMSSVLSSPKKTLQELRREKKTLELNIRELEMELTSRRKQATEMEPSAAPGPCEEVHEPISTRIKKLSETMRKSHKKELRDCQYRNMLQIQEMERKMEILRAAHMEEAERLKARIRQKMNDIHRREQLHKRLKHQIRTMVNYQAKNMNATVSIEECRRIVRAIIQEARLLRAMAEEREIDSNQVRIFPKFC